MASSHGAQAKTYVGGRDLSGYLSQTNQSAENDKADVTVFSSTAMTYIAGLHDQVFSGEGVWDAQGTVGSDAVLGSASWSGSAVFSHFPAGDAIGSVGFGAYGIETKYEIDTPVEDANRIKFEAQSSRGFDRLVSLEPLTASFTAGTAASSVDNGAATSNGGAGYFHVTALNGGTIVGKIQHSTDNSSWSDLITFSNVTAGGSALATAVTGTVNRYLRFNGTATGGTATIHAAFARVP